jgi:hypothetical protein
MADMIKVLSPRSSFLRSERDRDLSPNLFQRGRDRDVSPDLRLCSSFVPSLMAPLQREFLRIGIPVEFLCGVAVEFLRIRIPEEFHSNS